MKARHEIVSYTMHKSKTQMCSEAKENKINHPGRSSKLRKWTNFIFQRLASYLVSRAIHDCLPKKNDKQSAYGNHERIGNVS